MVLQYTQLCEVVKGLLHTISAMYAFLKILKIRILATGAEPILLLYGNEEILTRKIMDK